MKIKISKSQWEEMGKKAGWTKSIKTAGGMYDDNFGAWHSEPGEEEDTREFYDQVQKESVWKKCRGCGRRVKLRPHYDICNNCADRLERGEDIGDR